MKKEEENSSRFHGWINARIFLAHISSSSSFLLFFPFPTFLSSPDFAQDDGTGSATSTNVLISIYIYMAVLYILR